VSLKPRFGPILDSTVESNYTVSGLDLDLAFTR